MENKSNKLNQEKQKIFNKSFFSDSLSEYAVLQGYDVLSKEQLNFLANKINWKTVPDFYISGKIELIKNLDWIRFIDRMQALRIAMRDLPNLYSYPLQVYEYEADEIIRSAKIEPDLLDILKIKKGTLKPKHIIEISKVHKHLLKKIDFDEVYLTDEESVEIAKTGIKEVLLKVNLNLENIGDVDKYKIVKSHSFSEESLIKMGFFENSITSTYHIREILLNTEDKYIDRVNTEILSSYDWIMILKQNPDMEKHIKLEDFFKGDIFYFVELCVLFPKYIDYINEDIKNKITSLGWEKLLLRYKKDDRLVQLCDFDSIEERTWKVFADKRPELLIYRY